MQRVSKIINHISWIQNLNPRNMINMIKYKYFDFTSFFFIFLGHHHHNHHHHTKKKMTVVKQFGSLGKKFRKNLAKITHTGSFRSAKDTVDYARYIHPNLDLVNLDLVNISIQ